MKTNDHILMESLYENVLKKTIIENLGDFEDEDHFLSYLLTTLIPDLEDSGRIETAKDFKVGVSIALGENDLMDNFDSIEHYVGFIKNTLVPDLKESGMIETAKDFMTLISLITKKNNIVENNESPLSKYVYAKKGGNNKSPLSKYVYAKKGGPVDSQNSDNVEYDDSTLLRLKHPTKKSPSPKHLGGGDNMMIPHYDSYIKSNDGRWFKVHDIDETDNVTSASPITDSNLSKHLDEELVKEKEYEYNSEEDINNYINTARSGYDPNYRSYKESHNESYESVKAAIGRRIYVKHSDLLVKYGIDKVMDAIEDIAGFVTEDGDLQEIGSSDISAWTNWVVKDLTRREDTIDRFQRMNDTWNKTASPEAKAGKEKLLGMMGKFGNSLGPEGARG
jgi:hypothetical protein